MLTELPGGTEAPAPGFDAMTRPARVLARLLEEPRPRSVRLLPRGWPGLLAQADERRHDPLAGPDETVRVHELPLVTVVPGPGLELITVPSGRVLGR